MAGYGVIAAVYFLNVCSFFMFARDKHKAVHNMDRTPEWRLLLISAIGGAFGALMGMWMFRHKTLKNKFRILIPIFLIVQILILYILGYVADFLPDM